MNDLLLLAALLAGPQHGYALKKQVGLISGKRELHNNLVYPLFRRFVQNAWVSKRHAAGQRGQTRELYALTAKGKQELLRRLAGFTEKEAVSENEFHLRVGLFTILSAPVRARILAARDSWLATREQRLARVSATVDPGPWGGEVVHYLRERIQAERKWIAALQRKSTREIKTQRDSSSTSRRIA
jgi:DNA-binding PadR family transcriptional regulator